MRMRISKSCLVVLCVGVLLVSCGVEEPPVPPPAQSFPTSEATNATTVFLTGSVVTTRLTSHRLVHYSAQDSAWAYELTVEFYDDEGTPTSVLVADSALVREKARFLEVYGDVLITTDDGRTLDTDRMAWDDEARLIHTESYVEITEGDDVMAGYGFESDPELSEIRLREVTGKLADPETLDSI